MVARVFTIDYSVINWPLFETSFCQFSGLAVCDYFLVAVAISLLRKSFVATSTLKWTQILVRTHVVKHVAKF